MISCVGDIYSKTSKMTGCDGNSDVFRRLQTAYSYSQIGRRSSIQYQTRARGRTPNCLVSEARLVGSKPAMLRAFGLAGSNEPELTDRLLPGSLAHGGEAQHGGDGSDRGDGFSDAGGSKAGSVKSGASGKSNRSSVCGGDGVDKLAAHLGGKTIGWLGSVALTCNNVAGAGMLAVPAVYQQAGWVVPTVSFVIIAPLAALCANYFCDAIALMPRNASFGQRVEFSDPFRYYAGQKLFAATHCVFYLCLLTQNIASIVFTAQVCVRAARRRRLERKRTRKKETAGWGETKTADAPRRRRARFCTPLPYPHPRSPRRPTEIDPYVRHMAARGSRAPRPPPHFARRVRHLTHASVAARDALGRSRARSRSSPRALGLGVGGGASRRDGARPPVCIYSRSGC